ncbi:MAG TPA: hypothetical protein VMJ35_15615 [Dongiaceae bacterium]|nr:hypothetical protein [Dongiaceae bacterium]
MSTSPAPKKSSPSPKSKSKLPFRIVPLHPHVRDTAAPTPQLTYRGGPLLTNVEVFTIFWGSAWQDPANATLVTQINSFFDEILASSLMDQLAEYNVDGKSIGRGVLIGTNTFTDTEPAKSIADSALQTFIQSGITAGTFPAVTANTLYFLYLPPGVAVKQGTAASCKDFCGYHDATPSGGVYYAVMPYPGCSGCLGGLDTFPALTSTSSHELCEAITDPVPGQGWYDDNNGEIGDICAWNTRQLGNYTIQLEWSNKAGACI